MNNIFVKQIYNKNRNWCDLRREMINIFDEKDKLWLKQIWSGNIDFIYQIKALGCTMKWSKYKCNESLEF